MSYLLYTGAICTNTTSACGDQITTTCLFFFCFSVLVTALMLISGTGQFEIREGLGIPAAFVLCEKGKTKVHHQT